MLSTQDIAQLERKYQKYIFKKRFKVSAMIFLIIIILAIPSYLFLSNPNLTSKLFNKQKTKTVKKTTPKIEKIKEKPLPATKIKKPNSAPLAILTEQNTTKPKISETTKSIDKNITKKPKIEKTVIPRVKIISDKNETEKKKPFAFHLLPSFDTSYQEFPQGKLTLHVKINKIVNRMIQEEKPKSNEKKSTTIKQETPKKDSNIKIEINEIDSIKYLKEKFQKTNNIIFALMLCEEYYSMKDYKNTLKWSIIANDIDSQSERSWIWFAKAKYRLKQKEDAIKALKAYLSTNSSETIRELLNKIQTGELND